MGRVRHPDAPFDLTSRSSTGQLLALATPGPLLGVILAAGGATPATAVTTAIAVTLVVVAVVLPRPRVVARADALGWWLHGDTDQRFVPWEDVTGIVVAPHGAPHLLELLLTGGQRLDVVAAESPGATALRLRAAKVAGLLPGWVRLECRAQTLPGPTDVRPRPRPDLI